MRLGKELISSMEVVFTEMKSKQKQKSRYNDYTTKRGLRGSWKTETLALNTWAMSQAEP
jgi:hypothetical protein